MRPWPRRWRVGFGHDFSGTSALYALADQGDPHHAEAKEWLRVAPEAREALLTHNYILVEAMAVIQHRLGRPAALKLARSAEAFEVEWVHQGLHEEAVERLARASRQQLSLVDQVSFLVMLARGVTRALAFDQDFLGEGFQQYIG